MILIIDNYDSFTYNLYQGLSSLTTEPIQVVHHDKITADEALALNPRALVISPGPGTPDEAGISLELIQKGSGRVPILGVCLGHQCIGQVFGGVIGPAPKAYHGRIEVIEVIEVIEGANGAEGAEEAEPIEAGAGAQRPAHRGPGLGPNPLFKGLEPTFTGTRYHSLAVTLIEDKGATHPIPKGPHAPLIPLIPLVPLAQAQSDGVIMALAHRDHPTYGLQFHPESMGTAEGMRILENFLHIASNFHQSQPLGAHLASTLVADTLAEIAENPVTHKIETANLACGPFLKALPTAMISGALGADDIKILLTALAKKGIDNLPHDLLSHFVSALRAAAIKPFEVDQRATPLLDLCGTGGDGLNTFNISTLAALVVASMGIPTAKHGNRAQSGRFGSFDLIEALGISFDSPPDQAEARFRSHRLALLYAPRVHPAMKPLGPIRKSLPFPTVFNLVGPLANPMAPRYQVVGVYSKALLEPMARTLAAQGLERGAVISGFGGLDELSLEGPNRVQVVVHGRLGPQFDLDAGDFSIPRAPNKALEARDGKQSLAIANALISGHLGPQIPAACLDVLCFNAALALCVATPQAPLEPGPLFQDHLQDAIKKVSDHLRSGQVRPYLDALKET